MRGPRWPALIVATVTLLAACAGDDGSETSEAEDRESPTDESPVARGEGVAVPAVSELTGGRFGVPYNPMPARLAEQYDYVETEYQVAGEAAAYTADDLAADGVWSVAPADRAPYVSRVIARRPADPAAFNGTVVVEWLNVTAGRDSDPDFGSLYPLLLAEGYGYLGVSAQQAGVEAGGPVLEVPGVPPEALAPLTGWDPERYGDLDHPGDAHAFDLFSQAAQLAWRPEPGTAFADLAVTDVIAVGQSQSAGALATYVNAVHPVAGIFDGFLIHGRSDSGLPLDADAGLVAPRRLLIRTDLNEPVLQFVTETDLTGLGFLAARQDDGDRVVTWEVAATAHADQATLDYGVESGREWDESGTVDFTDVCGTVNDGPQAETLRAAFAALTDWVRDGTAPPTTPRLATAAGAIVRDDYGIALGGARTPPADAPVAALTGENPSESVLCTLFGGGEPLTDGQLAELYTDAADYVDQVTASAEAAVDAGWLLPADAAAMVAEAEAAAVP